MLIAETGWNIWFIAERTNTCLDAFKAVMVRFETNAVHWKALNWYSA
jgi:hypothetical protein